MMHVMESVRMKTFRGETRAFLRFTAFCSSFSVPLGLDLRASGGNRSIALAQSETEMATEALSVFVFFVVFKDVVDRHEVVRGKIRLFRKQQETMRRNQLTQLVPDVFSCCRSSAPPTCDELLQPHVLHSNKWQVMLQLFKRHPREKGMLAALGNYACCFFTCSCNSDVACNNRESSFRNVCASSDMVVNSEHELWHSAQNGARRDQRVRTRKKCNGMLKCFLGVGA
mmetsp:Transcript_103114/g.291582  ORF Transcript_103114/g.291582 Transcript_103114/m.291582 type:complete len:227 (-) Transcript_103114:4-684(-)